MLKTIAIGHLGNDATVNQVSGNTVINFNVAHSESYKDAQGNKMNKTTWVSCSYWTDRTAVAPYLTKGTLVCVEGVPSVDTYQNKDNKILAQFRLRVSSVQLLGSSNRDNSQQQNQGGNFQGPGQGFNPNTDASDDLPF